MSTVLTSLTHHSGMFIMLLLVAFAFSIALSVRCAVEMRRIRNRFRDLLQGARGETLELLLQDHLNERLKLQTELQRTQDRVQTLETKMRRTKRHLGLVRYDAFEDVGGAQSFALAIHDDEGDGAVLTSLVGRSDCRVYCKPLAAGKSERSLSDEELEALRQAATGAGVTANTQGQ